MLRRMAAVSLGALMLVASACSSGDDDSDQRGTGGASSVSIELADFSITPSSSSTAAGDVTFVAENAGPSEHELVVLRTDLAPGDLTIEDGKVDEDAAGIEEIGEIEEFAPGATEEATFDLESGSYLLICNVVGHAEQGMVTEFEVA